MPGSRISVRSSSTMVASHNGQHEFHYQSSLQNVHLHKLKFHYRV